MQAETRDIPQATVRGQIAEEMSMKFQEVMQQFAADAADERLIEVPEHWGQGRAVFGGMAAALALAHLQGAIPDGIPLRSVSVSFVAPLNSGEAVVRRKILRQGKSVVQAQVEIEQAGQVVLAALASFGAARQSQLQVPAQPAPEWPHRGMQLPDSDLAPEFTRHFDYRIQQGNAPFSGGNSRTLGGAIRFRGEFAAAVGVPELLALVDAWPPVSLGLMQGPAPASSLTWTLELLPQSTAFSGSDWWAYLANIEHGADGYHHIEAKCWAPDGSLIAISRQTVTVFA